MRLTFASVDCLALAGMYVAAAGAAFGMPWLVAGGLGTMGGAVLWLWRRNGK